MWIFLKNVKSQKKKKKKEDKACKENNSCGEICCVSVSLFSKGHVFPPRPEKRCPLQWEANWYGGPDNRRVPPGHIPHMPVSLSVTLKRSPLSQLGSLVWASKCPSHTWLQSRPALAPGKEAEHNSTTKKSISVFSPSVAWDVHQVLQGFIQRRRWWDLGPSVQTRRGQMRNPEQTGSNNPTFHRGERRGALMNPSRVVEFAWMWMNQMLACGGGGWRKKALNGWIAVAPDWRLWQLLDFSLCRPRDSTPVWHVFTDTTQRKPS